MTGTGRRNGNPLYYFRCSHCGTSLGYEERDSRRRPESFTTMPGVDAVQRGERLIEITCTCGRRYRFSGYKRTVRFRLVK